MKPYRYIALALMAMMTLGLKAQELQPDARYKLIRESYTINDDGTSDIQYRK